MADLIDRLRETRCDREAFTPDHAQCICRLTGEAADTIERLRTQAERSKRYWIMAAADAMNGNLQPLRLRIELANTPGD